MLSKFLDIVSPHVVAFAVGYLSSYAVARVTNPRKFLSIEEEGRDSMLECPPGFPFGLTFNGKPVDSVFVLAIRIWNRGTDRVVQGDLSKNEPLRIILDRRMNVLGAPIVLGPDTAIGMLLTHESDNTYKISFEGFNPGEWSMVHFYFTGDLKAPVRVSGRIYGQSTPVGFDSESRREALPMRLFALFFGLLFAAFPITLAASLIATAGWFDFRSLISEQGIRSLPWWLSALYYHWFTLGLIWVLITLLTFLRRLRLPRGESLPEDSAPGPVESTNRLLRTAFFGSPFHEVKSLKEEYDKVLL